MGILMLNSENYSSSINGGVDVEANPQDTPSDTLSTIGIDGVVYEIDVAGSGQYDTLGMPMEHDSTTEHVVGTDENGETIYEITIKAPTMSWSTGSGYVMYRVDTSCITDSVKRVWWVKGMLHDNNDNRDLPIPYFRIVDSESIYYQLMQLPNGSVSLGIFVRSSNAGGYIPSDLSVTIRYTKL